jgi:predicted small lipoprotein YifL
MKKVIFCVLIAASVVASFTACSSKKILPVPPSAVSLTAIPEVTGALSNNIEVVSGSYKLELEITKDMTSQSLIATLNVKTKVKLPIEIPSGSQYGPELAPVFLDQNGAPVNLFSSDLFSDNRYEVLASSLKNEGEVWVKFQTLVGFYSGDITDENIEEVQKIYSKLNEVKKVSLASTITNPKGTESVETGQNNSSGTDCETFLNEYEKFVMAYIDVIKKYKENPTDNSILTDYSKMVAEANDWTGKIQDCQNDSKFAQKYMELTTRIATAASQMN